MLAYHQGPKGITAPGGIDGDRPMGTQQIIESLNEAVLKTDIPRFDVGDTINVHVRIVEGQRERVQIFQGVLISRKGRGINEMITVRRIVDNIGVERTFPLNSPLIAQYEVVRRGDARRAKLYYLRDRVGKSRRLRDRRRGMKHVKGLETIQK
jgi:large subunit ribosomal protein L19